MPDKTLTCCFTGHRPNKLPWHHDESDPACLALKARIAAAAEAVYDSGIRHYLCGMAEGCDLYFCEAVLALRQRHPDLTIEAAVPWEGQAERWREDQRQRYMRLLDECDYQTLVQQAYSPDCMRRRNRYMVDQSGVVIGAYTGQSGGTMSTLLYAMRQGVEVILIEF